MKTRWMAAGVLIVAAVGSCQAGIFSGKPYDLSLGPYVGTGGYSYNVAYSYGLPFISNGPYDLYSYPYDRPYQAPRPLFPRLRPNLPPASQTPEAPVLPGHSPALFPLSGEGADQPVILELRVPAEAEIWFNGEKTTQRGTDRVFRTPLLPAGKTFQYEVKVRWSREGKAEEQTKTIPVRAGEQVRLTFPTP
jgi:uncharacterized protein (TIGR03000 family)